MKIVSENSEADLQRRWALQDIEWPLRELAANIIRVVRGAGKPYEIADQAAEVIIAFQKYREVVGYFPSSDEIQKAINIRYYHAERPADELTYAVDKIVQGALQVAASRVVSQPTQESARESEVFEGVADVERARDAINAEWEKRR